MEMVNVDVVDNIRLSMQNSLLVDVALVEGMQLE